MILYNNMNSYYEYIGSNADNEMKLAWKIAKSSAPYKYEINKDYLDDVRKEWVKEYKLKGKDDVYVSSLLTETFFNHNYEPEYIHKLIYLHWLSYEYDKFKKNYKANPKDTGLNFMFITFNFKDTVELSDVQSHMTRIINLPILSKCKLTYCYEKHTATSSHIHIHMLAEMTTTGTTQMGVFLQKVYQQKDLIDILKIDYKFSWAKDYDKRCQPRAVCMAYVTGNKIDDKQEQVAQDDKWRLDNGLQKIYTR